MALSDASVQLPNPIGGFARRTELSLLSNFLILVGDWIYSVTAVIIAFHLGGGLAAAGVVLLLHAGGRLFITGYGPLFNDPQRARVVAIALEILRLFFITGLLFAAREERLWLGLIMIGFIGILNPIIEGARERQRHPLASRQTGSSVLDRIVARWDQIAMISGAIIAGLVIATWDEQAALFAAIAVSLISTALLIALPANNASDSNGRSRPVKIWPQPSSGTSRSLLIVLMALSAGAALGIAIRLLMVHVVLEDLGESELVYGLVIALAGAGAFIGPLSVTRLLGRLPTELVLAGITAGLTCALLAVLVISPIGLLLPIVLLGGVLAITGERAGQAIVRRIVPDHDLDQALWLVAIVTVAGQIVALSLLAGLYYLSNVAIAVVSVSALSIVCAVIPILIYGRNRLSVATRGND